MLELLSALGFPQLKHGRTCCLIHGGDSATSLSVDSAKGVWHCFVCGQGGGKLKLIERVLDCDRKSALRWLADLAGVQLDDLTPEQKAEWSRKRVAARMEGELFYIWIKDHIELLREYRTMLLRTYHGAKRFLLSTSATEDRERWNLAASVMENYFERIEDLERNIGFLCDTKNYPSLLSLYRTRNRRVA